MGSDMFGAAGSDITLKMPVGTIISDAETGEVLYELLHPGEVITTPLHSVKIHRLFQIYSDGAQMG